MNQVTTVRKYLKREQWKTLIKECQSSGMTVNAWCNLNNICEQTYYRNLKILRSEICENLPVPTEISRKTCFIQSLTKFYKYTITSEKLTFLRGKRLFSPYSFCTIYERLCVSTILPSPEMLHFPSKTSRLRH